jgi:hypothetical protein
MNVIPKDLQNPFTSFRDAYDRKLLVQIFPDLKSNSKQHFLALRPYAISRPERFLNQKAYTLLLNWLKDRDSRQRNELCKYLVTINGELSRSLLYLRQINSEPWHDIRFEANDDYDLLKFIDRQIHPTYLRLVEGVLAPLIKPVAHFMRLDRNKGTEGLDIYNLVEEIDSTEMAACVAEYNHTIRNGIGHGSITYMQASIRYCDKKGNEVKRDIWSIIRLCDDLLDTCNGLASAIKVFLILSHNNGYKLPLQLLIEELIEETSSPWWKIEGCLESELGSSRQLIIYAKPNSRDYIKIYWASLHSAIMASFLTQGYDRYFFSLKSPKSGSGWAAFDGKKLLEICNSGSTDIANYAPAVEKGGLFYFPKLPIPRLLSRIDTFFQSLCQNLPILSRDLQEKKRIPNIYIRNVQIHRNGWRFVLRGSVVIEGCSKQSVAYNIRHYRRYIVRKAIKKVRTQESFFNLACYLPLGYVFLSIFERDFRKRRLTNFGLEQELIGTLQLQRIRRIKSPDIWESTIETKGNWRIAWNRAWIESGGKIDARS